MSSPELSLKCFSFVPVSCTRFRPTADESLLFTASFLRSSATFRQTVNTPILIHLNVNSVLVTLLLASSVRVAFIAVAASARDCFGFLPMTFGAADGAWELTIPVFINAKLSYKRHCIEALIFGGA